MRTFYTKEQLADAREASLYDFMLRYHADIVKRTGTTSIDYHPEKGHHIVITANRTGAFDNLYGKRFGNIDFLVDNLGYSVAEAVEALTRDGTYKRVDFVGHDTFRDHNAKVDLPEKADNNRRVFAYLHKTRGIPNYIIQNLIDSGLLYQDIMGNCVFVNSNGTFFEKRGTLTDRPFHQNIGQGNANYWSFSNSPKEPHYIYVCEASIDAVSLGCIHLYTGFHAPAIYVSIGGVNNHQTIDRLIDDYGKDKIVLAVDNECGAGQKCRERYPDLKTILPVNKDWNDDLTLYSYKKNPSNYIPRK